MNCSNKSADLLKALCSTLLLLVSANACTEVDDQLGSNLLPDNQKMKIRVSTLDDGIKTYLYKEDSLVSSRLGYGYIGNEHNDTYGARRNSLIVQFLPSSYPTSYSTGREYPNYGINPIVDSVYIQMPLYAVHGDTTKVQHFEIYGINGPELLSKDSTYYTQFPIDEYKGTKLFTFSHTGRKSIAARLFPTAAGKAYLNSIVNLDWDTYKNDTLFLKTYKGLYITPEAGSPVDAAVYASSLANAGLLMYARCHDTLDVSAIYDTLRSTFTFADQDTSTTKMMNVSVNIVDFDYTGSALGALQGPTNNFTDTLENSVTQPLIYVQPMGGVTGYFRFTDEFITHLRDLKFETDEDTGTVREHDIMISQAMMYVWVEDPSYGAMDSSLKRLGSYTNLRRLTGIPDYQYTYERYVQTSSDETYSLTYNGYLNRSNGYYEMDITSYIQQLAKGKAGDPNQISPVVSLAPDAYNFYGFGQSTLCGSDSSHPVKIRLTYALIEEK